MADLRITGLAEEMSSLAQMPWSKQLEEWPEDSSLTDMRGISRHIVRLIKVNQNHDSPIFAIKETVPEFANREYALLRELNNREAPCVEPVAVIENRKDDEGNELPASLVTHYLPFSLPYRVILSGEITPHEITNMANALALLLVRLHLLGFWWGDCSLSIPGLVTIIAALIGTSLLGLVGGILAVPIAAAVLLILDEVVYPKADKN